MSATDRTERTILPIFSCGRGLVPTLGAAAAAMLTNSKNPVDDAQAFLARRDQDW